MTAAPQTDPAWNAYVAELSRGAGELLLRDGHYAGESWRTLDRYGEFHEGPHEAPDLQFIQIDQDVMQAYAALSAWGRLVMKLEPQAPVSIILASVATAERVRYPTEAFPYDQDPGKSATLDALLPLSVATSPVAATIVERLGNGEIRHEWTTKPGKRIYDYLIVKLPADARARICDPKVGLLAQYEERHDFFEVIKELALLMVPLIGHEMLFLPLATTTAMIAVHRGMHLLCATGE